MAVKSVRSLDLRPPRPGFRPPNPPRLGGTVLRRLVFLPPVLGGRGGVLSSRIGRPGERKIERRNTRRHGFTLLESIIALVIAGIIAFALAMSLSVALQAQSASTRRQEDNGEVRAIFGALTRDLTAAYGSMNNPASVFIAGGGQGSQSALPNGPGLLTLTTLSHRIQADALTGNDMTAQPPAPMQPQSDCALVRYDLDTTTGRLTRMESAIPNPQAVGQTTPDPANVLSNRVLTLQIRCWDPSMQSWRDYWDFEQQNQSQSQSGSASGTSNQNSTNNQNSPTSNNGTGDSTLPSAVEVTLALRRADGTPATYTTLIPIAAPQPQPNETLSTTTGSSTTGSSPTGNTTAGNSTTGSSTPTTTTGSSGGMP